MSGRRPAPRLPGSTLATVWQAASVLLDYPDERQQARLRAVLDAVPSLPAALGDPLARCARDLAAGDGPDLPCDLRYELQRDYVETFDTRRRCSLFLTYFLHGDTRRRGVALLRFQQTYLSSGVRLDDGELPDHLCVVLEYAATVDRDRGWTLLLDHRAGLELLRLSLRESGSRWAPAVAAVCATLPPLRGDERDAVLRLAAQGPPEEEVGLVPLGTRADLPTPTVRGA